VNFVLVKERLKFVAWLWQLILIASCAIVFSNLFELPHFQRLMIMLFTMGFCGIISALLFIGLAIEDEHGEEK